MSDITGIKTKKEDEDIVLERIAQMPEPYCSMGKDIHEVIMQSLPDIKPRLWYGMPGYAKSKSTPVICFFRADKYMTFGLTENAKINFRENIEDQLIECAWFFKKLNEATKDKISTIVKQAFI